MNATLNATLKDISKSTMKKESQGVSSSSTIAVAVVAVAAVALLTACQSDQPRPPPYEALAAIAEAEDRRSEEIEPAILDGLTHELPVVRTAAYRALGRHERPEWLDRIATGLADSNPTVRGAAAIAIGQSVFRSSKAEALARLAGALVDERDVLVRGIIAETAGRMASPVDATTVDSTASETPDGEVAESILLSVGSDPGDPGGLGSNPTMLARPVELLVRGFEHLARRSQGRYPRTSSARSMLTEVASFGRDGPGRPTGWAESGADLASARVRRTALSALAATGDVSPAILSEGLSDPDAGVRVVAANLLVNLPDIEGRRALIERQLTDPYFLVRYVGLNAYDRWLRGEHGCGALLNAVDDEDTHVAVRALDLLGSTCQEEQRQQQVLRSSASMVAETPEWHRPVHAWVSLARTTPSEAAPLLAAVEDHPNPFARAYAARGAVHLGDTAALRRLGADADPNVRGAALAGLGTLVAHQADDLYRDALTSNDPGLARLAAALLAGTPSRPEAAAPLWRALQFFTAGGRETERDARIAVLSRLAEVASAADSARLRPYLRVFDVELANAAAELLSEWSGRPERASPQIAPPVPAPPAFELARLDGAHVVLHMQRGGVIRIRLSPLLAPTNAMRFARMAESGDLDGRTFHRVVPGFVIQGGSWNANEYAGQGRFTRDELGLGGHWRGFVGVSTRGRDTGDGQIFINLVDNLRLDHDYTVFGQVITGMDVVDRVLEGDVIARAVLEPVGGRLGSGA